MQNILIYQIGYVTVKNLSYAKINTVIPLGFIIYKINEYIEESSGFSSYLQNERHTEKYEELPNKTRDLIRLMINNYDDYDENHMKIKFNLNDNLPLKRKFKLYDMAIIVTSVFHKHSKYYNYG